MNVSKREKSFKRKIATVQEIIETLSNQKNSVPKNSRWNYDLWTRISAKVQLELCVSERKAREYIKLVKVKMRSFDS
jgi:hypothetical protein